MLISFSHGYSATLAAKLIIKLDLTWLDNSVTRWVQRSLCHRRSKLNVYEINCPVSPVIKSYMFCDFRSDLCFLKKWLYIDKMTVMWQLGYTARFQPMHDAVSGIAPSQVNAKICFEMNQNIKSNPDNPSTSNTISTGTLASVQCVMLGQRRRHGVASTVIHHRKHTCGLVSFFVRLSRL